MWFLAHFVVYEGRVGLVVGFLRHNQGFKSGDGTQECWRDLRYLSHKPELNLRKASLGLSDYFSNFQSKTTDKYLEKSPEFSVMFQIVHN